ncbi:TIGR02530 family flagellar biosynthesis protein [Bacillus massiliigorillae]|uniref:TIGR02530 family flagellar biosynthesis protein n=1 Tax=Bacillus massiliigorillae TaxID=1243664 RepID=UPI0003A0D119|nr:TIGR02530 family flagellar biosynthesis protein [Bacillus massiliigorillae]
MKAKFHQFQATPLISNLKTYQAQQNKKANKEKFATELQQSIQQSTSSLTISKHAQMRMQQRNIEIHPKTWALIEQKVQEAKNMGVKDSLVLLNNAALIVSAKNNVIVTAMGREEANAQIFTNINGTILLD